MPTYEYECDNCEERFEVFQRITEAPRKRCPKCRGKVRRLLGTGAGLLFKGSGFHVTDYRSEGYKKAAQKETPASPDSKTGAKPPAAKQSHAKSEGSKR